MRPRVLPELDPLLVPLPHGTEVTTRVERQLGDRHVPAGAIGRVVGSDGDALDVRVVGVGVVRYSRSELVGRKVGQMRFAARRAASWEALRESIVLEAMVGSHAWGLADAESDVDRRGIFALPFDWVTGLRAPPETLISPDGSATYWEAHKAIRQGLRADPNTLELLFLPGGRPRDPIGAWILEARDAFVSAEIYASFGRYALSQLRKLSGSLRLAEHRTLVVDWLRQDPPPSLDEVAERLAVACVHDAPTPADAIARAREYVKQLYRSLHDQGRIASSDFAALVDWARRADVDLDLPRELRPKNAYNLLRLIRLAIDWLETGAPVFEATGAFRDRLLSIKRGEVSMDEVLREAEVLTPALEAARQATRLPPGPDLERADALVGRIDEEVARRWLQHAPVPFGPPPPEPPRQVVEPSLGPEARAVAARVVFEESTSRQHVVIALSGAHAYGFPSPDSDLDLKGVHLEPAHRLLGLSAPSSSTERMEIVDGIEVDYSSNEVLAVLQGICRGNGNYFERILGSRILLTSAEHETLVPIVRRALSRLLYRHYRGFATGQLRELCSSPVPTVKQALYILRTTLTGAHVLLTGQLVTDLNLLYDEHGFPTARDLVQRKRSGEQVPLASAEAQYWRSESQRAFDVLDAALARSCLPDAPPNRDELEAWLLKVRGQATGS